ncbi:M28 family metallopeptidase [Spartinivicinus marinus]|nr:M28 family metallopeptidase [Spartinivicinus marinus]MCX4026020.1 M28 family metallopeptidase [Spartinivicinus marinus]
MKKTLLPIMLSIIGVSGSALANDWLVSDSDEGWSCEYRANNTPWRLMRCVTANGVMQHLNVLQAIADANNGTRVAGSNGYTQSVQYIAHKMSAAGYKVELNPFSFRQFKKLGPATLKQTSPRGDVYEEDKDFRVMSHSDGGDETALVTAVDLDLGPDNKSSSGCEADDFVGFPQGHIALIQRGSCSFQQKAENAANAGAVGAIIFNQGNTDDRKGLMSGTLSSDYSGGIPVFFATYDNGVSWADTAGLNLNMSVKVDRTETTTYNVIAESRLGNPNNVVMVGAHLDSVDDGPGINDNGSGSAAVLEVALKMKRVMPKNKLRFAWWGAEEFGLVGSTKYVESLSDAEKDKIALYLNFDMVGSTNYKLGVYDGDGSEFGLKGPKGSDAIEALFNLYFNMQGTQSTPSEISFRSDYAAFFNEGIPFGGLFTGAEGIKTEAQAKLYGGKAGEPFDPCYHAACDTTDNISKAALEINADAIGLSTLWYAFSTESVNGGEATSEDQPERALRRSLADEAAKPKLEPERLGHMWLK